MAESESSEEFHVYNSSFDKVLESRSIFRQCLTLDLHIDLRSDLGIDGTFPEAAGDSRSSGEQPMGVISQSDVPLY